MKKTVTTAFLSVLIVVLLVATVIFAAPRAYAAETDTIAPPTEENATESEIEAPSDIPTDTESEAFDSSEPTEGESATEAAENRINALIDSITSSSLWMSIGAYVMMAIGVIAFVAKYGKKLSDLIKSKADKEAIRAAIDQGVKEMRDDFDEEYGRINAKLEQQYEKEKQMWAILTIFMTHAKIPQAAKSEIMNCITGIKDMTGDLHEIVEKAEEAIIAAEKEAAENATPTPALDDIVNKAKNVMELG